MDGGEAKESAVDGEAGAAGSMILDASCAHESKQRTKKQQKRKRTSTELDLVDKEAASAEWQREIDALFDYYKEVSGYQLKPEEIGCSTNNSIIACLLEESSLPYAKLVDEIYERMELQDGGTEFSVSSSVLKIGERLSYGISDMSGNVLADESESSLWCWETRDLKLLPAHLHGSLKIRRRARKLIHERILALSGNLSTRGTPKVHVNQHTRSVNTGNVLNLDGIRSLVEKLKADMAKKEIKTKEISIRNAAKEQQKIYCQVQKEQKQKERELKRMAEKAEKEEKRAEREKAEQTKRLKKHQEEVKREQKRREKEQAELKSQASIQKQANIMERFLKRNKSNNMESSDNHYLMRSPQPNSFSNIEDLAATATSAMDCMLSQANSLRLEEIWMLHIAGWRKLSRGNRLCRWGVRRSPKTQLIKELKLQKSSATAPSENMSTPTKEKSSQMENSGILNFVKLLDELKIPHNENDVSSKTTHGNTSSVIRFVKKLLQFDKSHRPAYYGTWRKKSSTVSSRHPFKMDPNLDYEVDSDEEWEEEEPGESLSDFDNDDEETMNEDDSKVNAEEETENSFVVPNDYLSEDEGVQYEPLSGKLDESSRLLSIPGVAIEELNVLLQQQKALHSFTEHALRKDRPLVVSNLYRGKVDLLNAEDITGILKVEQLCLQALCMREYPGGPIVDVPVDVNLPLEDQKICRSNKMGPSTPVASKSISDSDLPEFVKLIKSCHHGIGKLVESLHGRFPCVSKVQLKNKIREIAEFTNNHWKVKKDILDRCGLSLSPNKSGSPKDVDLYFSKRCQPPDESGKSVESSPKSDMKSEVGKDHFDAQESSGNAQAHSLPILEN